MGITGPSAKERKNKTDLWTRTEGGEPETQKWEHKRRGRECMFSVLELWPIVSLGSFLEWGERNSTSRSCRMYVWRGKEKEAPKPGPFLHRPHCWLLWWQRMCSESSQAHLVSWFCPKSFRSRQGSEWVVSPWWS